MKLTRFKVMDFRSVHESGWIEVDNVTALIGVNESGKTNLLLPLWKLNPARDGEIQQISDFPKTMFGEIRAKPADYPFVTAEFTTDGMTDRIAQMAGVASDVVKVVQVTRFFNGSYNVTFPEYKPETAIATQWVKEQLSSTAEKVSGATVLRQEGAIQQPLIDGISQIASQLLQEEMSSEELSDLCNQIEALLPDKPAKTSKIVPVVKKLLEVLGARIQKINAANPGDRGDVFGTVISSMPKFVYYSNYGNLDSEIYLPHVVENLKRDDLGSREAAKARTLRVLFSFVDLEAEEILELGKDFHDENDPGREPTEDEIENINEAKQTRSILLQSAGSKLTEKFREWWRQGDYRFRFEADGNHFRIWVSDDRRPTEVELENRSSGLQWFLSFYLVFLVESSGQHENATLLLDEPGLSLHPLAQRDLSAFFESLSKSNPIIYTSHSPFLVDADRLERARKVYVAADGTTKATPDLRHSEDHNSQAGAAYAVHSALNLNVAESLLLGCQPIIVEGASDQLYLTTIKALLVSGGRITPGRELVFPPSGGTKNARTVASILTGRDENLPVVLLDADDRGKQMAKSLKDNLYADQQDRVLSVGEFVDYDDAEIEDLFPFELLAEEIDRMERKPETRLADVVHSGQPFVGQVEAWVDDQGVTLPKFWKVELAKRVKQRALAKGIDSFKTEDIERWVRIFDAFTKNKT